MFPTKGPNAAAFGKMNMEGADLARAEIARATSALHGANASLRVRPVALVGCDDSVDAMRAARHMVDDVGVPAVLGFSNGTEVEDIAGSLLIRRGVVAVASLTASPLITRLPQPSALPRMVWRTSYSVEAVGVATSAFLHEVIEPRLASKQVEIRISLVRTDALGATSLGEALYRELVFNGKTAVENGDRYQELVLPSKPPAADVESVARALAARTPRIIVLFQGASSIASLVPRVEAAWPNGEARPVYVVAGDSIECLTPFMGSSTERRRRVFGVSSISSQTANARFVMRFEALHPGEAKRAVNPGVTYDAFYALAYATFALGEARIDGPSIARAFARLVPPGRPIENGPTSVLDALAALARGESIDLAGASGSLDFDIATGDLASELALTCASVDSSGRVSSESESGLVYNAGARRIEGTMRCR
jgi:branched-chain amino acid transport system substrate-binding protein